MHEWIVWDIEVMDREEKERLCGTRVEEINSHTTFVLPDGSDAEDIFEDD